MVPRLAGSAAGSRTNGGQQPATRAQASNIPLVRYSPKCALRQFRPGGSIHVIWVATGCEILAALGLRNLFALAGVARASGQRVALERDGDHGELLMEW